jgi:hypothetical protein
VLADKAAFFVDSRYTVLARELVDGADWSYQDVPQTGPADWLAAEATHGARIGYDPMLDSKPIDFIRFSQPRESIKRPSAVIGGLRAHVGPPSPQRLARRYR